MRKKRKYDELNKMDILGKGSETFNIIMVWICHYKNKQ